MEGGGVKEKRTGGVGDFADMDSTQEILFLEMNGVGGRKRLFRLTYATQDSTVPKRRSSTSWASWTAG